MRKTSSLLTNRLLCSLTMLVCIPSFSMAESVTDCERVFLDSPMKEFYTEHNGEFFSNFRTWLRTATYESAKKRTEYGGEAAFVIDGIPLGIGGSAQEDSWREFESRRDSGSINITAISIKDITWSKDISERALLAYQDCLGALGAGEFEFAGADVKSDGKGSYFAAVGAKWLRGGGQPYNVREVRKQNLYSPRVQGIFRRHVVYDVEELISYRSQSPVTMHTYQFKLKDPHKNGLIWLQFEDGSVKKFEVPRQPRPNDYSIQLSDGSKIFIDREHVDPVPTGMVVGKMEVIPLRSGNPAGFHDGDISHMNNVTQALAFTPGQTREYRAGSSDSLGITTTTVVGMKPHRYQQNLDWHYIMHVTLEAEFHLLPSVFVVTAGNVLSKTLPVSFEGTFSEKLEAYGEFLNPNNTKKDLTITLPGSQASQVQFVTVSDTFVE